ncbi:hypothetical protein D4R51_01450 [bacterium]|nr:MAG: hypothetical protein D4R51_01450 [bacterium]
MKQFLLVFGFKNILIFPQRPVPHGVFSGIRYVLWMLFELIMKMYLLVETGSPNGIFTQNIIAKAEKNHS